MKTWAALLLIGSLGMLTVPHAHAQTAGQMATDCAPYQHALILQSRPGGHSLVEAPGANNNSAFCWGAFAAVQDFAALQGIGAVDLYPSSRPAARTCVPPTIERLQLVEAV
jgi:hypothetical protein